MINRVILFSIVVALSLNSCATYKYKKQGFVQNESYYVEIPFTYEKGFIFIPVIIQGKTYNFLLDTGAELNLIDSTIVSELGLKTLKKGTVSTGNDFVKKNERIEIDKIDIGGIEFCNTVGLVWNISKFGKHIRCEKIDGLIGNNLMRKANWQIDYQKQIIRITDNVEQFNISNNSKKIKMDSKQVGNVYLNLEVNQKKMPFTFDTGFNGFAQTGNTDILEHTTFITKIGLKGVNVTGAKKGITHYVKLDTFKINTFSFDSPSHFLVKPNNSSVLGNKFYEKYVITIDWNNDYLILDKNKEIKKNETTIYEVSFFTDYEKRIITIANIDKKSHLIDKITPNSRVLKINDLDLIKLSDEKGGLCTFWSKEWNHLKSKDTLNLRIECNGIQKDIEVKKIKNVW